MKNLGIRAWLVITAVLIVLSFLAPIFLPNFIDFKGKGETGDVIGGIMNPFIAIASVIVTYLAFKMQFVANRDQRSNFSKELKDQRIEFKKSQIENQFYEMLRLYKENVNEQSILFKSKEGTKVADGKKIRGREVFTYYLKELEQAMMCVNLELTKPKQIKTAYQLFFKGYERYKQLLNDENLFNSLVSSKDIHSYNGNVKSVSHLHITIGYEILKGHENQLGHYFRHLYQTVKFIADTDETYLSEDEKKNYLKVLRSQISNNEQLLLFYNYLGGDGSKWENEENKFFSKYEMIHNIDQTMVISGLELNTVFNKDFGQNMFDYRSKFNTAFILRKTQNGKFNFFLKARDGEVILQGVNYNTIKESKNDIYSVKDNATNDARYDRKTSGNGMHYFTLKDTNGEIIGFSEMYISASSRDSGIESVKKNAPIADI